MKWRLGELFADPRLPVSILLGECAEDGACLLSDESRRDLAQEVGKAQHFDCGGAANWWFTEESLQSWHNFPPLRLPYPQVWAEFVDEQVDPDDLMFGILAGESNVAGKETMTLPQWDAPVPVPAGAVYAIGAYGFAGNRRSGMLAILDVAEIVFVDEMGVYIHAYLLTHQRSENDVKSFSPALFKPALFGLALANVKRARITNPCTAPARRKDRKLNRPRLAYRTIVLPGTPSGGHRSGCRKGQLALHLVRGHFATYTDNAPLFGKRTGTYWRPAHARGNPERGVSDKRYRVI